MERLGRPDGVAPASTCTALRRRARGCRGRGGRRAHQGPQARRVLRPARPANESGWREGSSVYSGSSRSYFWRICDRWDVNHGSQCLVYTLPALTVALARGALAESRARNAARAFSRKRSGATPGSPPLHLERETILTRLPWVKSADGSLPVAAQTQALEERNLGWQDPLRSPSRPPFPAVRRDTSKSESLPGRAFAHRHSLDPHGPSFPSFPPAAGRREPHGSWLPSIVDLLR